MHPYPARRCAGVQQACRQLSVTDPLLAASVPLDVGASAARKRAGACRTYGSWWLVWLWTARRSLLCKSVMAEAGRKSCYMFRTSLRATPSRREAEVPLFSRRNNSRRLREEALILHHTADGALHILVHGRPGWGSWVSTRCRRCSTPDPSSDVLTAAVGLRKAAAVL